MQRADVLHCVMRPTAVCRGSSVYRRVQPAICIWHPQGRLPRLSTFFVFVGNSHNLKIISSSFEVIRAPDQLLTTSHKRKMPPCTQEKTFSLEESCFAYLEGALCYLCVRETHLATSSLPLQRPWHCPTSIVFWYRGNWSLGNYSSGVTELGWGVNIQHVAVCALRRGGAEGGQSDMISKWCLLNFKV